MVKIKTKKALTNTSSAKLLRILGLQLFLFAIVAVFALIPMRPDIIFGKSVEQNPHVIRYASGRGGSYAIYINSDNEELSKLAQTYGSSLSYPNFAYFSSGSPNTDNVKYEIKRSIFADTSAKRQSDYGAVQSTLGYAGIVGISILIFVLLFTLSTLNIILQHVGRKNMRIYLTNSKYADALMLSYFIYVLVMLLLAQMLTSSRHPF